MVLRLPESWSNWDLEMLVFEEKRITQKPLGGRDRNNNKLNPHMASTPGFEHGPHCWEACALTPVPHFLPFFRLSMLFVMFTLRIFHHFKSSIILQMFRGGAIKYVIFLSALLGIVILTKVFQNVIENASIKSKWWCISYLVYFLWLSEDWVNE